MNPVDDAIAIWTAGVAAVEPGQCVIDFFQDPARSHADDFEIAELKRKFEAAQTIRVVGAGKAGARMVMGLEKALETQLHKTIGIVNVPEGCNLPTHKIRLHVARPAGSNFPTQSGVDGTEEMIHLLRTANTNDVAICLLSGGGSALMPAPANGIQLEDKQLVTKLLHHSGATINEMNCVRKHLSRCKGGHLANAFQGESLVSLILSDVLGDPMDVIASGPTIPDPTTFQDALAVLGKYRLTERMPFSVVKYLQDGERGINLETPKTIRTVCHNYICASNNHARTAAWHQAIRLMPVDQVANTIEHDSQSASIAELFKMKESLKRAQNISMGLSGDVLAAAHRTVRLIRGPHRRPKALILGGETTVNLGPNPGKGGRNQEFVLAMLCELGEAGMAGVTILCAGTDGEDGPTDAAGAIGTADTLRRAKSLGLDPHDYLRRHDSYHFFEAAGGLFKTGLTGTNVMDLGVILLM